jgi:septum formation protein
MPTEDSQPKLILASASPRRSEILDRLGLIFEIRPVDIDESPRPGEPAEDYVDRLAHEKAQACGADEGIVIAADTVVLVDGKILGKPLDQLDAERMLASLSGRRHEVLTAVAVRNIARNRILAGLERSMVSIANLSDEEVFWYVATGEPLDKAGSYAIQGVGALFVTAVEGNYSNVVGLPLPLLYRLLSELGYDLRSFRQEKV